MVSYKALNTTPKSTIPNRCHRVWNNDAFEGLAIVKSPFFNSCHTFWNIDTCKGMTISVFTTDYYSIFYR